MFKEIVLFELKTRLGKPGIYLCFGTVLFFSIFSFATGSLPVGEKEHINAPFLISLWCAGISMLMMLISSSVMGTSLYRDIEFNTKDYYLTYPITKSGYFWGRYVGSFCMMLFIALGIILGIFMGTKLGPLAGWTDAKQYGTNKPEFYVIPFLTIALPNIFFTSSLFFGLVALTRNVKVIYSGGIVLFLGYFLSIFFLKTTNNVTVINLADPFSLNGIRLQSTMANSFQQNTSLIVMDGSFLLNRILWPLIGLSILLFSYFRFSFETFFSGKRDKIRNDQTKPSFQNTQALQPQINFSGSYNRSTLFHLTRLEILNILRDNYFLIILSIGSAFLGFVFWMGAGREGVPDFPRTVTLLNIFNDVFIFFIFFIIAFYTGETLHRDKTTRYAYINDSLPPPNWVLNGSKLLSLLFLGLCLSVLPFAVGLLIQCVKGFYTIRPLIYLQYCFTLLLPRVFQMVVFCYFIHVVINSKFVANGIAVLLWIGIYFLKDSGIFTYNLLLYATAPKYLLSDMDGIGHMAVPVFWFNLYWSLAALLLIFGAALFFNRGVNSSFGERLNLMKERFGYRTRLCFTLCFLAFFAVGSYVYYNVSYLHSYLTKGELEERAVLYEKTLKVYSELPRPKVRAIFMQADLFPEDQLERVKAYVTIENTGKHPISELLLDWEELSCYSVKQNGATLAYSSPLLYPRGILNFFRPEKDTAEFKLYKLNKTLLPGDSTILEVHSTLCQTGFQNDLYLPTLLHNGIFFSGNLPGLGYDEGEEESSPYVRRKNQLPEKKEIEIAQNDSTGVSTLYSGENMDLIRYDMMISTSADQTAVGTGTLLKSWKAKGRNHYHFSQMSPGLYAPVAVLSARYSVLKDSVRLGNRNVVIHIFFDKLQAANLRRFQQAYRDGLRYFSATYGLYPFSSINLAETSDYGPTAASFNSLDTYQESFAWNASFSNPDQFDYCYINTIQQLAQQWWRFQVAPNSTVGALVISEGLSSYSAIVLAEKKYGSNNIGDLLENQIWPYLGSRRHMEGSEHPLIKANQWYEWRGKAGLILYGLKDLIGEDSLNAALLEFKNTYAFKNRPPFPGANNLYEILEKHVPDSLKYYLTDSWKKITFYDNKVISASARSLGKGNLYQVKFTIRVSKSYLNGGGSELPATGMNDLIDIGVFGPILRSPEGRQNENPLFLKKYRLKAGIQEFSLTVKGRPLKIGIDPFHKLIDRIPADNVLTL